MAKKIDVQGTAISVISVNNEDYISLTDMLKAKDGDFFISDWLKSNSSYALNFNINPAACNCLAHPVRCPAVRMCLAAIH